jgi:hypothetical protein
MNTAFPVTLRSGVVACFLSNAVNHDVAKRWAYANVAHDCSVGESVAVPEGMEPVLVPREPSPDDRNREHAMALIARTRREAFAEAIEVARGCMWAFDVADELERRASHG